MAAAYCKAQVGQSLEIGIKTMEKRWAMPVVRLHSRKLGRAFETAVQ